MKQNWKNLVVLPKFIQTLPKSLAGREEHNGLHFQKSAAISSHTGQWSEWTASGN
ncbi:hypothetical protein Runsl_0813 [Runella slithyformis DSM 19594]|uniref:Uncharacterized protein n=1 Tax=Runella slithyformis (strain ATCC 29530 / DSM 19594 / LMG 11500 / NCIMB 11436 / LSU 4) TaxID=761193 RepID=A0A7U3ZHC4_RUNSL|nr:hypothetical protein Runsl_0813 [Runella slithyformis DSM 19594]